MNTETTTTIKPPWTSIATLALTIAGAAALAEWAMGRPLVSKSGRVLLWVGDVNSPENSQQLSDWYTFTHITHGFLLYLLLRFVMSPRSPLRRRFLAAVFVEAAWEVFENSSFVIERYRAATISLGYCGDSVLNSMSDIAACTIGFALARLLPARVSVALVVGTELALGYLVRDNLTLNVIMLVHPFEAIKQWQRAGGL